LSAGDRVGAVGIGIDDALLIYELATPGN
jgi:hypothetical protein